jgi:hypothetical protein
MISALLNLPSLKPELLPAVRRCLSKLENLTTEVDVDADDVFVVFIDVAGVKVKCLVDLSDFDVKLDTL